MARVAVAPAPTAPAPAPAPGRSAARTTNWGWKERAAQFYCLLILFGFPIFSVPCQKGDCVSPIDVVATYGYAKKIMPDELVQTILYPATLMLNAEVLFGDEPQSFQLPKWGDSILQRWNLTKSVVEDEDSIPSIRLIPNLMSMFEKNKPNSLSWEFVGACMVCILGGVLSIGGPNKISFWGVLLVLWYIYIDGAKRPDVFAQPMFSLVVICSLAWINVKDLLAFGREEAPPAAEAQRNAEPKKDQ